ncbi:hypothetical protein F5Y12DRAFT_710620 [Xylaria sp. FL1777]|nr:hypothetical protein F5Y12DRAFT_710620 [Xylaria sp. FL1777]
MFLLIQMANLIRLKNTTMRLESMLSLRNRAGTIFSSESCRGRPIHAAKEALTRFQARYSSTAINEEHEEHEEHEDHEEHGEYVEQKRARRAFRYYSEPLAHVMEGPKSLWIVHSANPQLVSLHKVGISIANSKLDGVLQRARHLGREMAGSDLMTDPTVRIGDHLSNLKRVNRWLLKLDEHQHQLMASRREYMGLCIAQILLNIIWRNPDITDRVYLALQVQNLTIPSVKHQLTWVGVRRMYVRQIRIVRARIPKFISLSQLESSTQMQAHERELSQDRFRRANDLIIAADLLFIEMRLRGTFRELMRLTDEMVRVTMRLDLINERIWLESHLRQTRKYMFNIRAAIFQMTGIPIIYPSPESPDDMLAEEDSLIEESSIDSVTGDGEQLASIEI